MIIPVGPYNDQQPPWVNGCAGAPPPSHPGYLVFHAGRGMPTVKHDSYEKAYSEATYFAELNPGQEYFIMEPSGSVKAQKPVVIYRDMK